MYYLDEPFVGKKERKYLNQCISSGWISSQGPFVKKFEKKFANYIGVKYAISCASGTAAVGFMMGMGIRWWEDVLGNGNGKLYSSEVLEKYNKTW